MGGGRPACKTLRSPALKTAPRHKDNPTGVLPEVEFVRGAGAQVLCVVEADETLGAVVAGQGRKEAGGLALITLALVIRQQLKGLPLSLRDALRHTHTHTQRQGNKWSHSHTF